SVFRSSIPERAASKLSAVSKLASDNPFNTASSLAASHAAAAGLAPAALTAAEAARSCFAVGFALGARSSARSAYAASSEAAGEADEKAGRDGTEGATSSAASAGLGIMNDKESPIAMTRWAWEASRREGYPIRPNLPVSRVPVL